MKSFERQVWRLLIDQPAGGAWNMAVDEAILESAGSGHSMPTLRLYAWQPPCLSLGYAQSIRDVDLSRLERFAWELVRRPTGGRAILHTDELTYSVIGPQEEVRLSGSILESYQVLAQALLKALHLLSVPAESSAHPSLSTQADPQATVCFEVPSNYEITVSGKKLLGSAQARRRNGVLQHGSLPLFGDITRINQALYYPDEAERNKAVARLSQRATTVEAVINRQLDWQSVALAFIQAFDQTLNLDLQPATLSSAEITRAEQLVNEKYAKMQWTARL